METVIYVDVLLVINFIINYLLILGSGRLAGRQIKSTRLIVASLFGAFSSLVIFLPFMGTVLGGFFKLFVSITMVIIAFPYINAIQCLKDIFFLFAVSFIFAGSMLALWLLISPEKMLFYNGVVYFGINAVTLIGITTACYLVVEVLSRIYHRLRGEGEICRLIISCMGHTAEVRGLVDNGNRLIEPFSDIPVIVCWEKEISDVVPAQIKHYSDISACQEPLKQQIRLIPYHAVGKSGILPAYRPDSAIIILGGHTFNAMPVYIAVSPDRIGSSEYGAIVNPAVLNQKNEQACVHS